jgi:hypothetical protein
MLLPDEEPANDKAGIQMKSAGMNKWGPFPTRKKKKE